MLPFISITERVGQLHTSSLPNWPIVNREDSWEPRWGELRGRLANMLQPFHTRHWPYVIALVHGHMSSKYDLVVVVGSSLHSLFLPLIFFNTPLMSSKFQGILLVCVVSCIGRRRKRNHLGHDCTWVESYRTIWSPPSYFKEQNRHWSHIKDLKLVKCKPNYASTLPYPLLTLRHCLYTSTHVL